MWNFVIGFFCGMMFVCLIMYIAFFMGGLKYEEYNKNFGPDAASRIDSGAGSN